MLIVSDLAVVTAAVFLTTGMPVLVFLCHALEELRAVRRRIEADRPTTGAED